MKQLILILYLMASFASLAQTPHLEGSINLDIPKGLITCELKFSNIPAKGNYTILLNSTFKVKKFKQNENLIYCNTKENDGIIEYELFSATNPKQPAKSIENISLAYTGTFRTYTVDSTTSDDMGVIAIKNNILRATVQSVFIPELVDRTTKRHITSFTYDITVNCSRPETVYLNGSTPQRGKYLHFKNHSPVDFLIYAGNYEIKKQGNLFLLNTNLSQKYIEVLTKTTQQISKYYAANLGIAYDANIVFPQIFTIGPKNQYVKWAFTVTPTIVMDVNELSNKINLKSGNLSDPNTFRIIAHEMAHKYFMQQLSANGTKNLWRFYHEAIAEYLALKAVEKLLSPNDYKQYLATQILTEKNKHKSFPTFDEIDTSEKDLTNASYYYYPLYLIGFEKMFGIDKTFELLRQLILDKNEFTFDTNYFKTRILKIGISQQDLEKYQTNYLNSTNCINQFNTLVGGSPTK